MWESTGIAPPFLTSAPAGGEWSASWPCCFTPRKRRPSTHWIGDFGGLQSQYGHYGEEKILSPSRKWTPSIQPVAHSLTDRAISTHNKVIGKVKAKLSVGLIHYESHHEDIWGAGRAHHSSLILALDGGEWSASCAICPRQKPPESTAWASERMLWRNHILLP
jgi:hypothetical protein